MGSSPLQFPTLDQAIAKFENTASAYNNPGGLMAGGFSTAQGATGQAPNGLATFPTLAAGMAAEDALVQHYANSGFSLADMVNAWAPPSVGNPNNVNYVNSLSTATGLPATAPVALAAGAPTPAGSALGATNSPCGQGTGSCWNPANWFGPNAFGGAAGAAQTSGGAASTAGCGTFDFACKAGLSWGRVAAFGLGFILVLMGLAGLVLGGVTNAVSRARGAVT